MATNASGGTETIGVLKSAVCNAKLGREEELAALRRLDDRSRAVERYVTGPSLKEIVAGEMDQSHLFGGRSVFGWEPPPGKRTDHRLGAGVRRPPTAG